MSLRWEELSGESSSASGGFGFAAAAGLAAVSLLVALGTAWALLRGGNDFAVFHEAASLVLRGEGARVYGATPDRYLYAPGLAWLLAPLGFLPREAALALWCFAKGAAIAVLLRAVVRHLSRPGWAGSGREGFTSLGGGAALALRSDVAWAIAAWGVVFVSRPLLIDFQYGQVNTFILVACVWALLSHLDPPERKESAWDGIRWFLLALAGMTKLFALPLLAVPWFLTSGISGKRLLWERGGAALGVLVVLLIPAMTEGASSAWTLLHLWKDAIAGRGFPLESHNQSVIAFLYRILGSEPTHVIAQGAAPRSLGLGWLGRSELDCLALAWFLISAGGVAAWILGGERIARGLGSSFRWAAVAAAALILPSHLVWKPYFVFTYPLAALAIRGALLRFQELRDPAGWIGLATAFSALNLTGFDFIGLEWAGRLESASVFMAVHASLLGVAVLAPSRDSPCG